MIEEGEIFNSNDVVSLFTNTPIVQSPEVIRSKLKRDSDLNKRTLPTVDVINERLSLRTHTNKKKDINKTSKGFVAILYVEGQPEPAVRIFRKHDIATAMSPTPLCANY